MTNNSERIIHDCIKVDANGFFICPYCSESFRALAYHTRQVHNISGKELRLKFKLPLNYSLQVPELKELRRIRALENNMDEQLIRTGQKTRFIKGIKDSAEQIHKKSIGHMKKIRQIVYENR